MPSFLFNLKVDWILKKSIDKTLGGIRWTSFTKLEDFDFADNMAAVSIKHVHIN